MMPLPIGTRVRVRRDRDYGPGPWPDEPLGTIGKSIDRSDSPLARATVAPPVQYWIVFDEPQRDADGDGPYAASEVLAKYIERLDDQSR